MIDKKSSIYSSRPASYVSHDLITRGNHLLVMSYGDRWRKFRKLIHQQFHEARCEKEHIILQNAEAVQMLRDFCLFPQETMQHPKRFSNSITMTLGRSGLAMSISVKELRPTNFHFVQYSASAVLQLLVRILLSCTS